MVEKIIVGKGWKDLKKYGPRGTAYIGKHIVGKGEESHLTNPIHMDVTRPHVVLVCGKRGTGKSYTAGVVAEEIYRLPKDIRKNICVLMIDTMGIYWSMKLPNERDADLLKEWGVKPEGIKTNLFVPKGYFDEYKKAGITVDFPFTVSVSELTSEDWAITFGFSMIDEYGILIEQVMERLEEREGNYSIEDIIGEIEKDERSGKKVKEALINRFLAAKEWGIFEKKGTKTEDLLKSGTISILDVSHYMRVSESWSIRAMVVGLLSRKIFKERLAARKVEEYGKVTGQARKTIPMIWIMIDEAHQFIPEKGSTAASGPLLTLVKEGREPGISMLMITQQPNKLRGDALSQADLIISHRLTSKADIEALRSIMQTYMLEDIQDYLNELPKTKGSAIVLDDNLERIYEIQVRPRFSWHAGGSPIILKERSLLEGMET
ncbi:MAG: DUF87 domain-containing protein [Candidatus Aenigmarchaeota archaeon]|nr:DUF87 domain-containing protein [Candidatus Aenigmarchaeota archaeon]NIP40722.1 DUF87 domain-containing protein [Candidatus Aenigmarchaeota archaeon]NIQ18528.1 DUF87 domain-containing protein [Candidatus Aenigmarchaeota archaeon]NIS73427.1 DUF87 domain-containing protein [Candidatus Aenigmarchaeota archaeon]